MTIETFTNSIKTTFKIEIDPNKTKYNKLVQTIQANLGKKISYENFTNLNKDWKDFNVTKSDKETNYNFFKKFFHMLGQFFEGHGFCTESAWGEKVRQETKVKLMSEQIKSILNCKPLSHREPLYNLGEDSTQSKKSEETAQQLQKLASKVNKLDDKSLNNLIQNCFNKHSVNPEKAKNFISKLNIKTFNKIEKIAKHNPKYINLELVLNEVKENKNATEVDKIKEMLPKSTSTSLDPIVGKPPAVKFSQDCVVAINNLSDNDFKEIFDHILENYPNDFDAIKSLYSKLNKDKKELVENLNIADSSWDTGFATIFLD